jgi:hypothetical protein
VRLREGLGALVATEALKTVPVPPKPMTFGLAIVANHFDPCLSSGFGSKWQWV